MTADLDLPQPSAQDIRAFKAACRQVLKDMGVDDVRYKTSKVTGMPVVIYSTTAARNKGIDPSLVNRRIVELSDEFGVDAGTTPAEYYQLPIR